MSEMSAENVKESYQREAELRTALDIFRDGPLVYKNSDQVDIAIGALELALADQERETYERHHKFKNG